MLSLFLLATTPPTYLVLLLFVATAGVDRFPSSPGVGNHLHAGTSCAAVIGTTRLNG